MTGDLLGASGPNSSGDSSRGTFLKALLEGVPALSAAPPVGALKFIYGLLLTRLTFYMDAVLARGFDTYTPTPGLIAMDQQSAVNAVSNTGYFNAVIPISW